MKSILYSEILVLTKSYKDGGFCVAGIDLTNNEFIRLVSNSDGGPLSDTETESISPLTVISFWGIPFPLKNQIENVIIDSEKQIWKKCLMKKFFIILVLFTMMNLFLKET